MATKLDLVWFKAAGIRAIKTFAQTAAGMIAVGAAFEDIGWVKVISVAVVATILSFLTSLKGLPETTTDGTLNINTTDPVKDIYSLDLDKPLDTLAEKPTVAFDVNKTGTPKKTTTKKVTK